MSSDNNSPAEHEPLTAFRNFDVLQWRQFWLDLINENPKLSVEFGTNPTDTLFAQIGPILNGIALPTREVAAKAMIEVLTELRGQGPAGTSEQMSRALLCCNWIVLPQVSQAIVPILNDDRWAEDIILHAATSLLRYQDELPITFWDTIDSAGRPYLAPVKLMYLAQVAPAIALRALPAIASQQPSRGFAQALRLAVRKVLKIDEGYRLIRETLKILPQDWNELMAEILASEDLEYALVSQDDKPRTERLSEFIKEIQQILTAWSGTFRIEKLRKVFAVFPTLQEDRYKAAERATMKKLTTGSESIALDQLTDDELAFLATQHATFYALSLEGTEVRLKTVTYFEVAQEPATAETFA
jgi:hypothetical protein